VHRLGPAVLLALLAAILISPVAEAKKKPKAPAVSVRTATATTGAPEQVASATASCPKGTIALGGGFDAPVVPGPSSVTDVTLLYESRRTGPRAWTVSGVRLDNGTPGPELPLTAYVTCRSPRLAPKKAKAGSAAAKGKPKRLQVSEVGVSSAAVDENESAVAAAACTGGRRAIGGGFSSAPLPANIAGDTFGVFTSSRRTADTTWTASLTNIGDLPRSITVYAYCAARSASEVSGTATIPPNAGFANLARATALSPSCRKGRRLIGGGFSAPFAPPAGPAPFPVGLRPSGGAWSFSAVNLGPAAGTLTSTGYCL
jgi:hypothetical protein